MIDAQSAAQAASSGIWIDRAVLALILANLGGIATFIVMIRKQRRTEGLGPGDADSCKKHSERLTKVETKVEGWEDSLKEFRKENREDHKQIFDALRKD